MLGSESAAGCSRPASSGHLKAIVGSPVTDFLLHSQKSYDHSYFFIATFIADHMEYHAKYLRA